MSALHTLGVSELRARLAAGEMSPVDAVASTLDAIAARDAGVGAYLEVFADDAMARARALADSGDCRKLPLGGVPIAIKDNICVAGKRTTCASRILRDYVSPYTATAAERLQAAGAIVLGKTNLDEFAMGSSTENSALGTTRNPWDPARAPGGSSGGSAAAVAAEMAAAALGSDTGGSIRQPASFCGVVGMKPTYGRVSRYGLVAFASSLDQIGPIARSVADVALVLEAMCGHDPRDATSLSAPVDRWSERLEAGLEGMTVGVPAAFLADMDATVRAAFDAALARAREGGARIREVTLPHAAYAVAAYYIIANAEASANLARYDGVKYGHRAVVDTLYDMYTRTRDQGFGAEVKRRILLGTYVLSAGYYDAYYRQAQKVRSLIIRDFEAVFAACDLLMMPTAPTPPFRLGEKIDDPILMYLSDVYTIPVNLAGLPGISLPVGLTDGRLPVGVQLVGRALDEERVLRGAAGLERACGFHERAIG
ncbi:MAG: Asp-tRNA(Asn)/Glu-tRNA(Gln) amidotransferase subunit GatA [Candidatus Krumholzibacteria bacterium]|nr:Asp-tRNA(Asn)/Glu-tRNA(Gln) amidotransferase subunit GatA [Candidatus Krumholzibacteria bacterium]